MRSYSTKLERIALKSLCSKDQTVAGYVLAHTGVKFFYAEESIDAYQRILHYVEEKGHAPAYTFLCEDPKLKTDVREYLSEATGVCKNVKEAAQLCDKLNEYRKARILALASRNTLDTLAKDSVDIPKLIDGWNKSIVEAQTNKSVEDSIYHVGKSSNVKDHVKQILFAEENTSHIPTGFETFDRVNIGMPRGGLFMLGGSTGAGKSHMAVQLGINVAMRGYKVVIVPLEMTYEEMQIRLLANASKTDSLRIQSKDLTTDERNMVLRRWNRMDKAIASAGGRLSIYKPPGDIEAMELTAAVHSYKPDVIIVDYVGLLSGADGDDQWRAMGRIARYFKNYADQSNSVSVLCAQVDAEGKLRYSRAMGEHASMLWYFVANKETKEAGHLNISQGKGRNMRQFDFVLKIDYEHSRVYDMPTSEVDKDDEKAEAKGKPSDKKSEYMPDLNDD